MPVKMLRPAPLQTLEAFYTRSRLKLPEFETLKGCELPEPYRSLLAHDGDMTPTLEKFHRGPVHLRVLRRSVTEEALAREVVLVLDRDERPVEFGAIAIGLNLFMPAARDEILEGYLPLGSILHKHGIRHVSRPKAFFRILADRRIGRALKVKAATELYGRCNRLLDSRGRTLAEIVEILPL